MSVNFPNRASFSEGTFHITFTSQPNEKISLRDILAEVMRGLDLEKIIQQGGKRKPEEREGFFNSISTYKFTQQNSQGEVTKTIVLSKPEKGEDIKTKSKGSDRGVHESDVLEELDFYSVHQMVVEVATPILSKNEPASTRNDRRPDRSSRRATTLKNDAIAAAKEMQKEQQKQMVRREMEAETSVEKLQENGGRQERDLRDSNNEKIKKADTQTQIRRRDEQIKEERRNG